MILYGSKQGEAWFYTAASREKHDSIRQQAGRSSKELWGYLLAMRKFWRRRRVLCLASPGLDFCKSFSETRASPPVLLDVVNGDPDDRPTV